MLALRTSSSAIHLGRKAGKGAARKSPARVRDQRRTSVHRRNGAATLVAAEPGEACGGTQFPELGALPLGDAQGSPIQFFSGLGMPLSQLATDLTPDQVGRKPALPSIFNDL